MKRDFLRLLKELDDDELREELQNLYDRFPVIREYYKLELSANTTKVLEKYKKDVRKAFFPSRGWRMSRRGRSNSNKIIKAFSEVSIHSRDLVELMFYRVEVMIEAIAHFRVDNESFHDSTVKSFAKAMALAQKEMLLDSFRPQIATLAQRFDEQKRLYYFTFSEVLREYLED
ncbi:MAG: DUF6155 family protein [Bacteroidota bacterium]